MAACWPNHHAPNPCRSGGPRRQGDGHTRRRVLRRVLLTQRLCGGGDRDATRAGSPRVARRGTVRVRMGVHSGEATEMERVWSVSTYTGRRASRPWPTGVRSCSRPPPPPWCATRSRQTHRLGTSATISEGSGPARADLSAQRRGSGGRLPSAAFARQSGSGPTTFRPSRHNSSGATGK